MRALLNKTHFVSQKKIIKRMCKTTMTESTNVFFHLLITSGFIIMSLYDVLSSFFAFVCFILFTGEFLI